MTWQTTVIDDDAFESAGAEDGGGDGGGDASGCCWAAANVAGDVSSRRGRGDGDRREHAQRLRVHGRDAMGTLQRQKEKALCHPEPTEKELWRNEEM